MTTRWRETAFAYAALPEVGALFLAATPAWVWSRDGARVLWANPAGGRFLGVAGFASLAERQWAESHSLRRAIASIGRSLPEAGMLARLRLADDLAALPILCRCRPIRAGGERAILVAALEASGTASSPQALAAFFSGREATAVVLDEAGAALAEGAAGVASMLTAASPSITFADAGRTFRLSLVERPAESPRAPPEQRRRIATGHLDDPGLSLLAAEGEDMQSPSQPSPGPGPLQVETPARAEEPDRDLPSVRPPARKPPAPRRTESSPPEERSPPEAPKEDPGEPEHAAPRSVMAGRVPREMSRKPVRFLWQTDAADRFLFVSPGLAQVVGRNADIVGERWQEASARLRLDPTGRIARALRERDTWSGLTAWWPVEGSNVRVPVELTALPVFGGDNSFQGYRGFGILRPVEALMPRAFEERFGREGDAPQQVPPYEESIGGATGKVVPIRADIDPRSDLPRLTAEERNAFEEIAAELRNRVADVLGRPSERDRPAPEEEDEGEPSATQIADRDEGTSASAASEPAVSPPPEKVRPAAARIIPTVELRSPVVPGGQIADAQRRVRELTTILDTATDGVIILDAEGTIESVNGSAEALFGLEAQEMVGRPFVDLLTAESRRAALDYLSGLKDSGVASLLNEGREVEAKAGVGTIPLFMTIGRLSSVEGGRYCAVLRDITHWKRIEAELTAAKHAAEHASSQKSDFLARVSHEVRTPLNTIIGFAEVMIEERFGPIENERYRDYLRDIRTSGEHVVSLVNDLLDISKIEAGKLDLHFSAVPLNALVQEAIGLMQPQANRARVVLRSSLSREVPAVVADERTMRQIVLNLLSNSVKFTSPGGQVIASTSLSPSGEAVLRIRDTGEGMTEEELARALEPFRQISTAALSDRTGTGLGLPLTKSLVEANRASLSIRSARGEGTVVTITIPPTRVLSE